LLGELDLNPEYPAVTEYLTCKLFQSFKLWKSCKLLVINH